MIIFNYELEFLYLEHFKSMIEQNFINGEYFCNLNFKNNFVSIIERDYIRHMISDYYPNYNNIRLVLQICEDNKLFDISNYEFSGVEELILQPTIKEKVLKDINKYLKLKSFL